MRLAKEKGKKKVDQGYTDFTEFFMSNIMEENKLEYTPALEEMVEKQFGNKFLIYNEQGAYFAMNVKYMGMGNWKFFNANNRASERGITEEDYYDYLQEEKESYYDFLDNLWNEKYGVHIAALGRSAGYIGVPIRDLVQKNYTTIFEMNDEKVHELYDEVKEYSDDPYEQGMDACGNVLEDDIPEVFRFSYDFDSFIEKFRYSVEATSQEWETKQWNDDLFERKVY